MVLLFTILELPTSPRRFKLRDATSGKPATPARNASRSDAGASSNS